MKLKKLLLLKPLKQVPPLIYFSISAVLGLRKKMHDNVWTCSDSEIKKI